MDFDKNLDQNSEFYDENDFNNKPYTCAPKMVESNEFGMTEIPLDIKPNTNFVETTFVDSNSNNNANNRVDNYFPTTNESNAINLKMTLPSVEDGLSSSSEISCQDDLELPSRARSLSGKHEDIILNSTMIRDLTKDIEDLRKTITSAKSSLDDPIVASSKRFPSKNDNVEVLGQEITKKMSIQSHQEAEFSTNSNRLKSVATPLSGTKPTKEYESDEDTDKLLTKPYEQNHKIDIPELKADNQLECERKRRGKEVAVRHPDHPSNLIEGLIFRANYLGSTQLLSESRSSRDSRMLQAQEAVGRVKAPDSETQPSVAVELFISTEKILVLNTGLSQIMMDHSLKSISYIADIGNILVLMARRIQPPSNTTSSVSPTTSSASTNQEPPTSSSAANQNAPPSHSNTTNKIICHVFESEEAQLIAQTIGNAFQVAYIEFLKANGIDDPKLFKEVDYQDVLNDQHISGEELRMFASSDQQKEVIIPKQKGELLGIVIVESGWGSMIPTVVLANMNPTGPAARCGLLNIGNQIISVNNTSLVGLPLTTCQQIIKKCKSQTAVKLVIVNCPPVVEVNIRRPDPKYQLGFSVQNGVICSLLRGGIAERGGVRVGHHIIEINGVSVVAMSHEKIVSLLATSYGEIHLRTMPSSIFRLLTGQEQPHYI